MPAGPWSACADALGGRGRRAEELPPAVSGIGVAGGMMHAVALLAGADADRLVRLRLPAVVPAGPAALSGLGLRAGDRIRHRARPTSGSRSVAPDGVRLVGALRRAGRPQPRAPAGVRRQCRGQATGACATSRGWLDDVDIATFFYRGFGPSGGVTNGGRPGRGCGPDLRSNGRPCCSRRRVVVGGLQPRHRWGRPACPGAAADRRHPPDPLQLDRRDRGGALSAGTGALAPAPPVPVGRGPGRSRSAGRRDRRRRAIRWWTPERTRRLVGGARAAGAGYLDRGCGPRLDLPARRGSAPAFRAALDRLLGPGTGGAACDIPCAAVRV